MRNHYQNVLYLKVESLHFQKCFFARILTETVFIDDDHFICENSAFARNILLPELLFAVHQFYRA